MLKRNKYYCATNIDCIRECNDCADDYTPIEAVKITDELSTALTLTFDKKTGKLSRDKARMDEVYKFMEEWKKHDNNRGST